MVESAPKTPQVDWIGRVIDNRYRIVEPIGRGGMGVVYKIIHTQLEKVAALKLLHSSLAHDSELLKRFKREATSISRLNHPNIVQVFDFGRVEDSMYLVMEYLAGEDLALILRRDGPVPPQRCLPILIQICDALTEAHARGVIHRDLKPENIRIIRTRDGLDLVKVLDFGLAKIMDEEDPDQTITERGSLMGTPYYMAPELIRAKPLDHRIDLYSLGAVCYRMLTAQNAFGGKTPMAVLTKHIREQVEPPSERLPEAHIPRELDAIVLKAMAKNPAERYQHAEELKQDVVKLARKQAGENMVLGWSLAGTPSMPQLEEPVLLLTKRARLEQPSIDDMVTPRLSKDDVDFERKLKRGRLTVFLIPLPLLAVLAGLLYWFVLREGDTAAPSAEVEPNNTPDVATLLLLEKSVTGTLGRRLSAEESDRDWYRLEVPGTQPQALDAQVTAIPNMDIILELFDAKGGRLTASDAASKGGMETIKRWMVSPGVHYLMVREVWRIGDIPTENVTDTYRLSAHAEPFVEEGWELEPNDTEAAASTLTPGKNLQGYLSPTDRDCFRVKGLSGVLSGEVSGVKDVDLVVEVKGRRVSNGRKRRTSKAETENDTGLLDALPIHEGERFSDLMLTLDQPLLLCLRHKERAKAPASQEASGLEIPYILRTLLIQEPGATNPAP